MFTPRSVDLREENSRLDEQIHKLRQCKVEMQQMFSQLDSLENRLSDTDSYGSDHDRDYHHHYHHTPKHLSKSVNQYYRHDSSSLSPQSCCNSDLDESLNYYEKRQLIKETTVVSYDDSDDSYREAKPPKPRTAKMKFSYKTPVKNNNHNFVNFSSSFDLGKLAEAATRYNENKAKEKKSSKAKQKNANERTPSVNKKTPFTVYQAVRPSWKPNGKANQNIYLDERVYSSNSSLARTTTSSSISLNKSLNPKLTKPWKHSGVKRPEAALFLSSVDLTKSTESLTSHKKKRNVITQKDVGKDWKPIGYKKPDPGIYLSAQNLAKSMEAPVKPPQKKQPPLDPKDIGKGWKPLGKSSTDLHLYTEFSKQA